MNDELTGQLAVKGWRIPRYAQAHLWLTSEHDAVQPAGDSGIFELTMPAQRLVVRWGAEDGAPLAVLPWQPDTLEWDGAVSLGGYVDSLHLTTDYSDEVALAILSFGGQPLRPGARLFPPASQRGRAPLSPPDYFRLIDDDYDEATTTWITTDDSPLLTAAQDALMNKLRVVFSGRLADDASGYAAVCALPLALGSVTLFAP